MPFAGAFFPAGFVLVVVFLAGAVVFLTLGFFAAGLTAGLVVVFLATAAFCALETGSVLREAEAGADDEDEGCIAITGVGG